MEGMICIRVNPEDKRLLQEGCEARGEDLSSFIRRALRRELALLSYYTEERKKPWV